MYHFLLNYCRLLIPELARLVHFIGIVEYCKIIANGLAYKDLEIQIFLRKAVILSFVIFIKYFYFQAHTPLMYGKMETIKDPTKRK